MSAVVAIIGRPNVGKSSLFNRMIKKSGHRKPAAITEETPGVTRDRNYGFVDWEGRKFTVIDTGGFYPEGLPHEEQEIADQVREQALFAIEEADIIVHLLDGKEGLIPSDREMAGLLRASGKKVFWVVNKIDVPSRENNIIDFYAIGGKDIYPVSAASGLGFEELMERIVAELPASGSILDPALQNLPKVAVIGKPNVGKSTLINAFLGKKRLIVSSVPGTTRDAIDSLCTYYGEKFLFIDTAGIRKKPRQYSVEGLSVMRTMKSIERADIVIVVVDASQEIGDQEQKIAGLAQELGKGLILFFNKWDLVKDPETAYKRLAEEIKLKLWFMEYVPWITASGLKKTRITNVFPLIREIMAERRRKIKTHELNELLLKILARKPFPLYRGKELKFYYITQTGIEPPTFRIFVNYPSGIKASQIGYIEKALRTRYSFKGTPIRIFVKARRNVVK
ncbi:MAG TPA: ribosome biogenesis GTPase Der [Dissulfurispiraceae bacterium]|nr:ribosome biogenesis GTPase Der [Dissulfurispiraceae bacterium]